MNDTLAERFAASTRLDPDGCLIWMGRLRPDGYGVVPYRGQALRAHRVAWELANGAIPDGQWVLHDCPAGDNRACVNVAHLWLGTAADNNRDCLDKNRHGSAMVTPEEVTELRRRALAGERARDLAAEVGIQSGPMGLLLRGVTWSHVPGPLVPKIPHALRGEEHGCVRLTEAQVRVLRDRYAAGGVTLVELAAELGVSRETVGRAIRRRSWKHIP